MTTTALTEHAPAPTVASVISALRERAEEIRRSELGRMKGRWEGLSAADLERLERLSRSIVDTLLGDVAARAQAAEGPQAARHVESLRHLFGLQLPSR